MTHKDREKAGLDYDEVLEYIGQFGHFQRKIFLWLSLATTAAGLAVVGFAFTGFEPKYRCRVAQCEDPTSKYFTTDLEGNVKLPSFYANQSIELKDRCKIPRCSNLENVDTSDGHNISLEMKVAPVKDPVSSQNPAVSLSIIYKRRLSSL